MSFRDRTETCVIQHHPDTWRVLVRHSVEPDNQLDLRVPAFMGNRSEQAMLETACTSFLLQHRQKVSGIRGAPIRKLPDMFGQGKKMIEPVPPYLSGKRATFRKLEIRLRGHAFSLRRPMLR
ncbi:hypothetical protein GCM10007071_27030 [Marinobacter zhanjiangensis]|uniref:Uncharacterized protein n=1 Tax=Marinobacter zhanjiangensis TaxID=578215 RepID=A0ABQ3B400_9GAMM|nr:hypothetical protein GCM10007071_27030 [Marinobacter zhanjiangensis]